MGLALSVATGTSERPSRFARSGKPLPRGLAAAVALVVALVVASAPAAAGTVGGKLELPTAPARPASVTKGFLERVENPLAPVKPLAAAPYLLVVLDGPAAAAPVAPGQVMWELLGESFARPVIGVAVGSKVEIKNSSRTPRTLAAAGNPKLIEAGPLNPSGARSFRADAAGVITIADADAPHLTGTAVVVASPYFAAVDANGKFELVGEVPEGTYKLRVFYREGWLALADEPTVVVPAKGKAEVAVKIPAGYPLKK